MISKTWKHKLQLQEGEDEERKWRTLDNHSIQTPLPLSHPTVCRCAIITMVAGPTIHIIHNFFLTLTLTKQNKMLSIVSVDHGNNMIVWTVWGQLILLISDIMYTDRQKLERNSSL